MPTNKPQVKAYIEADLKEKLTEICKSENRSESNMIEYLIKKHVNEYETQQAEKKRKQESSSKVPNRERPSVSRTG